MRNVNPNFYRLKNFYRTAITFNTNAHISGAENTCDCTCKDCVLEHCFSETISIYENSKLYVTVEQGKGITKFLDDNGVFWHLVE